LDGFQHAAPPIAAPEAELAIYPGAMHGFTLFPQHPLAAEANARIGAFLKAPTV